jgi:hypothetical protein
MYFTTLSARDGRKLIMYISKRFTSCPVSSKKVVPSCLFLLLQSHGRPNSHFESRQSFILHENVCVYACLPHSSFLTQQSKRKERRTMQDILDSQPSYPSQPSQVPSLSIL